MHRFTLVLFIVSVLAPVTRADERETIRSAASAITGNILRAKFDRVGVLPVLFEEDQRNQFDNAQPKLPTLRATSQGQMYTEMLESQLAENSNGAYRLVDGARIFEALKKQSPELSKLTSGNAPFQQLATAVDGLQALVVGTLRDRHVSPEAMVSLRDLSWKLIDLKDGSIVTGNSNTSYFSLANAIYQGRSQEYFRWENGRLYAVGFGWMLPPLNEIPLKPDDSLDLYRLSPDSCDQPHPILNPKCPFKVSFHVGGKPRGVHVPVEKETRNVAPFGIGEHVGHSIYEDAACLALDPGESLAIQVRNASPKDTLVAVFVDGINTLGKRRELPDDKCRVWSLPAGKAGNFRGWYSGPKGKEQLEEFVVTPWADSMAGQMGEKDQAGSITLVFFNAGWPARNVLAKYPRSYNFFGWWDAGQSRFMVSEGMVPPDVHAAAIDMFAMGAKKPEPGALNYQKIEPQGTVLCSMTVWYGPKSSMKDIAFARLAKRGFSDPEPVVVVEGRTNGQE